MASHLLQPEHMYFKKKELTLEDYSPTSASLIWIPVKTTGTTCPAAQSIHCNTVQPRRHMGTQPKDKCLLGYS